MAKEVKKGAKKVAAKTKPVAKTKSATRTSAKKTVKREAPKKKTSNIKSLATMFLLMLGVALVFVAFISKIAGYMETNIMITCLGVALVLLIISAFIKKLDE